MMRGNLQDVWEGVRSQPGRAALSFLAVAVGMTALSVLLATLGGLERRAQHLVRELGGQVFAVTGAESPAAGARSAVTQAQAALLAANMPDSAVSTASYFEQPSPSRGVSLSVVATDERLAGIRQWRIPRGRFLDAHDLRHRERHAVITEGLSRLPGWDLGRTVPLMGIPFTIVGIVEASGSALESEGVGRQVAPGEMAAFVPQSLLGLWAERNPVSPGEIGAVFVRAGDARPLPETLALARRLLGDAGGGSAGLRWITPDTVLRGTRRLQTTLVYTVGSVAALCLILGGTTLMSLMIANVRDRVTEIGLRRALGATPADVAAMFLLESCLVAGSAALLGAGLTHGLLWLGREQFPVALRLDALTLLAPVVLALLLAGVFSYGPARLAASIAPADALRAE